MTRKGNLIGKQVSEARNHLGLSQSALAAKCQRKGWDLSRDVLARIESGIRGITDKEIAIFSEVLGVPVQELLPARVSQNYVKTLKG
jgi:transcriptional regulator with XRE-family HTH domain